MCRSSLHQKHLQSVRSAKATRKMAVFVLSIIWTTWTHCHPITSVLLLVLNWFCPYWLNLSGIRKRTTISKMCLFYRSEYFCLCLWESGSTPNLCYCTFFLRGTVLQRQKAQAKFISTMLISCFHALPCTLSIILLHLTSFPSFSIFFIIVHNCLKR